jgi:hypothetical protein
MTILTIFQLVWAALSLAGQISKREKGFYRRSLPQPPNGKALKLA